MRDPDIALEAALRFRRRFLASAGSLAAAKAAAMHKMKARLATMTVRSHSMNEWTLAEVKSERRSAPEGRQLGPYGRPRMTRIARTGAMLVGIDRWAFLLKFDRPD